MSTVAEQFRHAREAQKLTIHQVAEVTKIRTDHLRALEEGNFDVFAAPVYIRGFVRTYATLLKLDVPQVMATLDSELGRTQKFSEPPPLSPGSRGVLDFLMLQLSKVNWQKGLIAAGAVGILIVVAVIFVTWRHSRTADPLKGLPPAIYRPATTNSGDTLPLPPPAPARRQ
jgi:cytoskeletal protein RodZ